MSAHQQRIDPAPRLVPAHELEQPPRIPVRQVGPQRQPSFTQQLADLDQMAGLLVRQPREPLDQGRTPTIPAHERKGVLGGLALAVQVVGQQGAQIAAAHFEPARIGAALQHQARESWRST